MLEFACRRCIRQLLSHINCGSCMLLAHADGLSPHSITLWYCYPITPLLLSLPPLLLGSYWAVRAPVLWISPVVDSIRSSLDPRTDPNITLLEVISARPFTVLYTNNAITFSWSNRNTWIRDRCPAIDKRWYGRDKVSCCHFYMF